MIDELYGLRGPILVGLLLGTAGLFSDTPWSMAPILFVVGFCIGVMGTGL